LRRRAKIDTNQPEIVKALRQVGASVSTLHRVGEGCPDLLVGYRGDNFLLEVKDGKKVPSKRKLTEDEKVWHGLWRGKVSIVESELDALAAIGIVDV
jgi:hypothetical protein